MTDRVVYVPKQALGLLMKAGIVPPEKPDELLDVAYVDAQLAQSNLDTSERMALKAHLRNARLLVPGRGVNMIRP
jgi:hypothetical protein